MTNPDEALVQAAGSPQRLVDLVFRLREYGIIAVLVIFVVVTTAIQPRFLGEENIKFVLLNATIFALLALGETMVVVSRQVDLSVGSVLGLSAYVSSNLFGQVHGIPIPVVFLVGLGIGVVNGAITAVARVPGLVVTLATLYIIRGIDVTIIGGGEVVASSLPAHFAAIGSDSVVGIPYVTICVAVVIAAGAYFLRSFRVGRELYAIGSNPDAARLVGIPIGRRVFTSFVTSGAIAGVAGVIWAAYYGTVDSTAGTGYELTVVTAVVVGGVAIFGGSGSVIGAAFGALLLSTIATALYALNVSPFWDPALDGFLLVLAITLDRTLALRLADAMRKRTVSHGP